MSKYFMDCEFLEGSQKERLPISLFRKNTLPTIDLISIGIVAEDGREYYAISKDFNLKEAWNRYDIKETSPAKKYMGFYEEKVYWIRDNVLKYIWRELFYQADDCSGLSSRQIDAFHEGVFSGGYDQNFTFKNLKFLIDKYGTTNKEIAESVKEFVYPLEQWRNLHKDSFLDGRHGLCLSLGVHAKVDDLLAYSVPQIESPEFYAYYADYDWVAFCWLFGKMLDLPRGFPMYCKDLKQVLDSKKWNYRGMEYNSEDLKRVPDYPKQQNEHSAIHDARFNRDLHKFLNSL